jgi:ADP-ribosyl-[dinitrogen reductase] hydrolase
MSTTDLEHTKSAFAGCLLAGAAGDALGAPVEFLTLEEILSRFGKEGIREYTPAYGGIGRITDDTQMTLFTAEGLIRGIVRGQTKGISHIPSVVAHAYQRWLITQGRSNTELSTSKDGWLFTIKELHSQRAPGITCLSALEASSSFGEPAINNSKGCGGVMRVAPVAMASRRGTSSYDAEWAFNTATELCALTHGHPSGQLSGGFFASFLSFIFNGHSKIVAFRKSRELLILHNHHTEVLRSVDQALLLANTSPLQRDCLPKLGEGWIAEEALAISLYCVLSTDSTEKAIILAVNHSGDSDSTGAITGNIMGAINGVESIPHKWLAQLELRDVIEQIAVDMIEIDGNYDALWNKYPGH